MMTNNTQKGKLQPGHGPLSRDEPIPGCPALHKEKRTLPGAPASFSGFVCVTALEPVARPADGLSTWAWWRWIGGAGSIFGAVFREVCPRQRGVIGGQTFNFGGLYLRPPWGHRLWVGGVR